MSLFSGEQAVQPKLVRIQSKPGNNTNTIFGEQGNMPELFTREDVRYVHLYYWSTHCGNCVRNCNGGMGITSGIEENSTVGKPDFLDLVDQFAFNITLKVLQFHIWEARFQLLEIVFKGLLAIHRFLPGTKQIQIGSVDDEYLHYPKIGINTSPANTYIC